MTATHSNNTHTRQPLVKKSEDMAEKTIEQKGASPLDWEDALYNIWAILMAIGEVTFDDREMTKKDRDCIFFLAKMAQDLVEEQMEQDGPLTS